MPLKFSSLEREVNLLLKANNSISTIISILEKSRRTINNAIQRIN
jgi:DNA-binding CsgD family transcriptional regulator